jgi:hypothetical protein
VQVYPVLGDFLIRNMVKLPGFLVIFFLLTNPSDDSCTSSQHQPNPHKDAETVYFPSLTLVWEVTVQIISYFHMSNMKKNVLKAGSSCVIYVYIIWEIQISDDNQGNISAICLFISKQYRSLLMRNTCTVELCYNDIGLCDTSSIASNIPWYQLIPHKARVFLPRLIRHT